MRLVQTFAEAQGCDTHNDNGKDRQRNDFVLQRAQPDTFKQ